jgi:tetratricopeptide (TPR) repeat protein
MIVDSKVSNDNAKHYCDQGNTLYHDKKYIEALSCYKLALAYSPNDLSSILGKGKSLAARGMHNEAIECFNKCTAINKNCTEAYFCKASVLYKLGRSSEAIICYDEALKLEPTSLEILKARNFALQKLNSSCSRKTTAGSSKSESSSLLRGIELGKSGKYEEAIESFQEEIKQNPLSIETYNESGKAFYKLGDYFNAIECFDKSIYIEHNNPVALIGKGDALCGLTKNDEANECYKKAIECYDKDIRTNRNNARAYNDKGLVLLKLNKHYDAMTCFNTAKKLDPKLEDAQTNKENALKDIREKFAASNKLKKEYFQAANALYEEKKYEEALELYDKALKLPLKNPSIYYNKGEALLALHKYNEALECYKDCIKFSKACDAKAYNKAGLALHYLERYKESLLYYNKALSIDSKNVEAMNNKGVTFIKLKKFKMADKCFESAAQIKSDFTPAIVNKEFVEGCEIQSHKNKCLIF